jgi:hypothetical protein
VLAVVRCAGSGAEVTQLQAFCLLLQRLSAGAQ